MGHTISQAPATVVLCNRALGLVEEIRETSRELSFMLPSPESLLLLSSILGWSNDARAIILEIKSQL